ncbi:MULTISPECIES: cation-transporting P-type ATPase [unclassified Lactococcus]|uniref:cation-transporting P-type ATPase n=1 Tax=unclassified Lactococcus TaxID=2643510 RepID=UPI001E339F00|nr:MULTISPECIES: cation-transporting P-type ATPase [unclassified Lactococcus]
MEYSTENLQKLISFYKSDIQNGLLLNSVEEHRQKWGENRFAEPKKESILAKIKNHLLEMMNLVLLFVAALSAYLAFLNDQNYITSFY